jgi:hypothetical protein
MAGEQSGYSSPFLNGDFFKARLLSNSPLPTSLVSCHLILSAIIILSQFSTVRTVVIILHLDAYTVVICSAGVDSP